MAKSAAKSTAQPSSLGLALRTALQAHDAAMTEALADIGITSRQLLVMRAVEQAGGGSQTAIVQATSIDRSTVADIVRRLEGRGVLGRERLKADGRAYAVTLTASGKRVLGQAEKVAAKVDAEAADVGGSKLVRDLARLTEALRARK